MPGSDGRVHETKGLFPAVPRQGRLAATAAHPAKVGDAAADGRRRGESTVGDKRDILVIGRGDSDIHLASSACEARR